MLKYLQPYDTKLQSQIQNLIDNDTLGKYILSKYTSVHRYSSDKALYGYVMELKNSFMKGSSPIAKVMYDNSTALDTHPNF